MIEQIGTPEEIYNRPRSRFVADFVGSANLIKGKLSPATARSRPRAASTLQATAGHKPHGKENEGRGPHRLYRPRSAARRQPLPGTVRQRLFHGDFVQYVIDSALGR